MRAHGGDIVLDSSGAGGTTFRLMLPDMPGAAPTARAEPLREMRPPAAS